MLLLMLCLLGSVSREIHAAKQKGTVKESPRNYKRRDVNMAITKSINKIALQTLFYSFVLIFALCISTSEATAAGTNATEYDKADASGDCSAAYGVQANASNTYTTANGFAAEASGASSSAFGAYANASGGSSIALGVHASATGSNSTATGNGSVSSGLGSTAYGLLSQASGS